MAAGLFAFSPSLICNRRRTMAKKTSGQQRAHSAGKKKAASGGRKKGSRATAKKGAAAGKKGRPAPAKKGAAGNGSDDLTVTISLDGTDETECHFDDVDYDA